MLKRFFLFLSASALLCGASSAQSLSALGIFNHVGADLSVSTAGIGVELSTPITPWIQLRAGASFMPGVTFTTNIDGTVSVTSNVPGNPQTTTETFDVDVKGDLARTQGDVIFNIYPFGSANSFFVAAGAYFGGQTLIKLDGHSDKVAQLQQDNRLQQGWVELGDYKINFEENGNVRGGLMAKNFRPYVGLGYGRPCPKSRVGFMIEAGVQFMGKMQVYQGVDKQPLDTSNLGNDDDWQKVIDKLQVYPMLKLTLTGRIF